MKNLEYKGFELKSIDVTEGSKEMFVSGYAGVFGNADELQAMFLLQNNDGSYILSTSYFAGASKIMVRDVLNQGSSVKTISERGSRIAFCLNHEIDEPVAKINELLEDETGIFFKARISDSEDDLKIKISEEIYKEMSMGFVPIKVSLKKMEDGTYLRDLLEIKIYEISIVTIGRNELAGITETKSLIIASSLIESLIIGEKNETKKFQLMQLKSLIGVEPSESLNKNEPINPINELNIMFN